MQRGDDMVRAYFRCNGGDYFCEPSCPFDGWSSPELGEFLGALRTLDSRGQLPSIPAFRELGLSEGALKRIVVIQFGSETSAFEALSPGVYIKDGVERKLGSLGPELT